MLPGPPVASRSFPQNDDVALFVEVYDNEDAKPHKVDIMTTVTTDEGTVVFQDRRSRVIRLSFRGVAAGMATPARIATEGVAARARTC